MKRVVIAILLGLITAVAFSACGRGTSSETPSPEKAAYAVEHHYEKLEGGYDVSRVTEEAEVGASVTAQAVLKTGYVQDTQNSDAIPTGTVTADGALTLKLFYRLKVSQIVKTPAENGTIEVIVGGEEAIEAKYGEQVTVTATPGAGYVADEITVMKGETEIPLTDGKFVMPDGDVTVSAAFIDVSETPYAVEYYYEKLDGGYEKESCERKGTAFTEAELTPTEGIKPGFVFDDDNAGNVVSGVISSDGSLTLKAYFNRVVSQIDKAPTENGTIEVIVGGEEATEAKYGEQVTVTATPGAGYVADEITVMKGETEIPLTDGKFIMPDGDVTVSAAFAKDTNTTYTVEIYQTASADSDEYALADTLSLPAEIGENVSYDEAAPAGYILDENHADYLDSGTAEEGGALTLKIYYAKYEDEVFVNHTEVRLFSKQSLSGKANTVMTAQPIEAGVNRTALGQTEVLADFVENGALAEMLPDALQLNDNGAIELADYAPEIVFTVSYGDLPGVTVTVEAWMPVLCAADFDELSWTTFYDEQTEAEKWLGANYMLLNDIDYAEHERNYILPIASINAADIGSKAEQVGFTGIGNGGSLATVSFYSNSWKEILGLDWYTDGTGYRVVLDSAAAEVEDFKGVNPLGLPFTGVLDGNGYSVKNAWLMADNVLVRSSPTATWSPAYICFIGKNAGTVRNIGFDNLEFPNSKTNLDETGRYEFVVRTEAADNMIAAQYCDTPPAAAQEDTYKIYSADSANTTPNNIISNPSGSVVYMTYSALVLRNDGTLQDIAMNYITSHTSTRVTSTAFGHGSGLCFNNNGTIERVMAVLDLTGRANQRAGNSDYGAYTVITARNNGTVNGAYAVVCFGGSAAPLNFSAIGITDEAAANREEEPGVSENTGCYFGMNSADYPDKANDGWRQLTDDEAALAIFETAVCWNITTYESAYSRPVLIADNNDIIQQ